MRKPGYKSAVNFRTLSHKILELSNRGTPKIDFLREILKILLNFSGCDVVELWFRENKKYSHCRVTQQTEDSFQYNVIPATEKEDGIVVPCVQENSIIDHLRVDVIRRRFDPSLPVFTTNGTFWVSNTKKPIALILGSDKKEFQYNNSINGNSKSLALFPLFIGDDSIGILQLTSSHYNYFTEDDIHLYEGFVETLGISLVNQSTQAALHERVKELTCLYTIAQVVERQDSPLAEILQDIVDLLPSAWQYPDITSGKIMLDKQFYKTPGFQENKQKQASDIIVNGKRRGVVEVIYRKMQPELDEGPFLTEERNLINTIAKQVALIVEQKEAEKDRSNLQDQLRHADRLATIGQLATGVAHEMNEPLGNILGFAQLAMKFPEIPKQVSKDLKKIVDASLQAREVIKKLMIFARQMPPQIGKVNINQIVNVGLSFLESRCVKAGIELVRLLSPGIPQITGDQVQLNQVLVNLVVNSIQAMPDGGKLTIQTLCSKNYVTLIVGDTGVGINKDIINKIFIPFFTTKDVNEGTGLGLAVVHGIVASHKGYIKVESRVGQGTSFEIRLPIKQL